MTKKLFLLDAYALIYRSYYAFIKNPRINSKGLNTSAPFGFTLTLDEVLRKEKPSHIAVVFDPPTPTFRHEMFPDYKAQRPPMPEDLRASIPYVRQIIEAFQIPTLEVNGFEADDVIGTIAHSAAKEGFSVVMMTPDKDFAQLVSENILMYKPGRGGNPPEILGEKVLSAIVEFIVDESKALDFITELKRFMNAELDTVATMSVITRADSDGKADFLQTLHNEGKKPYPNGKVNIGMALI